MAGLHRSNFPNGNVEVQNTMTRVMTQLENTPNPLAIDDESQEARDNSEYQVLWSSIMDKYPYKTPSTYKKVEVLILCWANGSDDIGPEDEVGKLKDVWEQRFHYHTQTEYLDTKMKQRLQVQINTKVAAFVGRHDGPRTLLIVYYAGHGRPGRHYGTIEIYGQTSENDERDDEKKKQDRVVWNMTEDLLRPAEADVLEIFDCCYAGTVGLTKGEERRSFEFLAATHDMGLTPVPGDTSFTSALICALTHLVDEKEGGRFTTLELLRRIKQQTSFPANQNPVLYDRQKAGSISTEGRIMLHPLHIDSPRPPSSPTPNDDLVQAKRRTITLRFDLNESPSSDNVKTLGHEINNLCERNASLGITRVRWGGLEQSLVVRAFRNWRNHARRSSMRRNSTNGSLDLRALDEWAIQDTPGPPTPSSSGRLSPGFYDFGSQEAQQINTSLLSPLSSTFPTLHADNRHKRQRRSSDA